MQNFKHNLRENLVALVGASLTSQVIKVTLILPEILTSCPYNCWPLLLRMSVGQKKPALPSSYLQMTLKLKVFKDIFSAMVANTRELSVSYPALSFMPKNPTLPTYYAQTSPKYRIFKDKF